MKQLGTRLENLQKTLYYMIGRKPDEFGLVPDEKGFFSLKEVFQVLSEEKITATYNDINELIAKGAKLELDGNKIRSKEVYFSIEPLGPAQLPKTVFTFVRKRAHEAAFEGGLNGPNKMIPLFLNRETANKIGSRRTKDPVIIEVSSSIMKEKGIRPYLLGEMILVERIPKEAIMGPRPEPKELPPKPKEQKGPKETLPGSFPLKPLEHKRGKKPKTWKESIRRTRKEFN
jgi:putative RNA 2'-phosphotransferase